jgi:hypothetical protein
MDCPLAIRAREYPAARDFREFQETAGQTVPILRLRLTGAVFLEVVPTDLQLPQRSVVKTAKAVRQHRDPVVKTDMARQPEETENPSIARFRTEQARLLLSTPRAVMAGQAERVEMEVTAAMGAMESAGAME